MENHEKGLFLAIPVVCLADIDTPGRDIDPVIQQPDSGFFHPGQSTFRQPGIWCDMGEEPGLAYANFGQS